MEGNSDFKNIIVAPITSSHSKQRTALRLSGASVPNLAHQLFGKNFLFKYAFSTQPLAIFIQEQEIKLELQVLFMPKNGSFTHEPVLEFHYPANETVTVSILESLYKLGVKPAEPGEFTKRAFLNGRLALSQSNSIAALVSANTEQQRKKALKVLSGNEDDFLVLLKKHLFELRRNLEAVIDFPEEPDIDHKKFIWHDLIKKIETHIDHDKNKIHHDKSQNYLQVVLLGPANAGKSSLIKALIPGSLPVISHVPGTTLDLIPYQMENKGQTIILYDSPGFKEAENFLDELSLNNLKKRISSFDVCLYLNPNSDKLKEQWIKETEFDFFHPLKSKADLKQVDSGSMHAISSLTGQGLSELKNYLEQCSIQHQNETPSPWQALEKRISNMTSDKINLVKSRLYEANDEEELAAYDLDELLDAINDTLYQEKGSTPLLDSIFKNFCIGK